MKPYIITIIFLLMCFTLCSAQTTDKTKYNALSFELGKTGFIYNLNYDHKFLDKDFGFRFGVGSNLAKYLNAFTLGGGGYHLIGKTSNFLEVGADLNYLSVDEVSDDQRGFVLIYPDYSIQTYYVSINIGYRRYGKSNLFRIGLLQDLLNRISYLVAI